MEAIVNYIVTENTDCSVTTVGSAAANNYYGTADQAGNVWEWNDAVRDVSKRGLRGGSWFEAAGTLGADNLGYSDGTLTQEYSIFGFRVASVPEPSAYLLTVLSVSALLIRRRRSTL